MKEVSTGILTGVRATQWNPSLKPHFGFQFLATCSRAYHDYHAMLYARNNFYLAPGEPDISRIYFSNLQLKHWLLIPRVIVYFGVLDITPHALASPEYATRHGYNKLLAFIDSPERRTWYRFLLYVERYLASCWVAKLEWLRDNVRGKEVILLANGIGSLAIHDPLGQHLGKTITEDMNGVCPTVKAFLTRMQRNVCLRVEAAIRDAFHQHADCFVPSHRKSIDRFKQWLAAVEEQEYLNERFKAMARARPDAPGKPVVVCNRCRESARVLI